MLYIRNRYHVDKNKGVHLAMEKKKRRRRKRKNPVLKAVLLVLLVLVLGAGIFAGAIFWEYTASGTEGGKEITFEIEQGQGLADIAKKLKEEGLIDNQIAFILKARNMGAAAKLRYGTFVLNEGASLETLITQLTSGGAQKASKSFTIPEGYSIEKMAVKLEEEGICSAADFLAAVEKDYAFDFLESVPDDADVKYRLQGFLYPDTYSVFEEATAEDIVQMMLEQFDSKFTADMRAKAESLGKSIFEVVTEASIVEREAQKPEERDMIAGVIVNRLEINMRLQMCPTALYPVTDGMYDKSTVTYADTEIDSPYNTYKYTGLPVGPICSPGIACLEAVLEPAEHDYLFYHVDETKNDGSHIFTETYQEHTQTQ